MRVGKLLLCLLALVLFHYNLISPVSSSVSSAYPSQTPNPVPQVPPYLQATGQRGFWFQTGAVGDNASYHFTGANITIRTTYDRVPQGDHSYWIGSDLSNGVFIQVGYLSAASNNGEICCAWFYEYFITDFPNPAVIGPAGSAGPIGSSHTYSMLYTGAGYWSFYMDNQLLGSPVYTGAEDSGKNAPAPTAEVAGAANNQDVLGPAEFTNLMVRQSGGWRPVPSARSLIFYGAGSILSYVPENPYGVWEVNGADNDFLAGSNIPQPSPVQSTPGATLWPVTPVKYVRTSFSFIDKDQEPFTPTWLSLRDSSNWALYTKYADQPVPVPETGEWTADRVMWHGVNVVSDSNQFSVSDGARISIQGNVFSSDLRILGALFSLPITGATVTTVLPDSTVLTGKTDSSGLVILRQLPSSVYSIVIDVPGGLPTTLVSTVQGPEIVNVNVFGPGELLALFLLPAVGAIAVLVPSKRKGARKP